MAVTLVRRPLLGRWGQPITAAVCAYEAVALIPGVPLPTISQIVWRRPWVGLVLLGLLSHHWLVEDHVAVVPAPRGDHPPVLLVPAGDWGS